MSTNLSTLVHAGARDLNSNSLSEPLQVRGVGPDIEVEIPSDPRLQFIIDSAALYVMRDGCAFEQVTRGAD